MELNGFEEEKEEAFIGLQRVGMSIFTLYTVHTHYYT